MSDLSDAHLVADEALRLKAEVERLRGLIRAVVAGVQPSDQCPYCALWLRGPIEAHGAGCPWPALVAEAEKS